MQTNSVIKCLLQILPLPLQSAYVVFGYFERALVLELVYIRIAPRIKRHIPRANPINEVLKGFREKRFIGDSLVSYARQFRNVLSNLAVKRTNVALKFVALLIIIVELDRANFYNLVCGKSSNILERFADGIHFQINHNVNQNFNLPKFF